MSAFKDILEDTVQLHRDEVMAQIKAILDEQGTEDCTVVTMEECPVTGKVVHDIIER